MAKLTQADVKAAVRAAFAKAGAAGGRARAAEMSKAERKASSANAIKARWDKYYAEHPDKKRPDKKRKKKTK